MVPLLRTTNMFETTPSHKLAATVKSKPQARQDEVDASFLETITKERVSMKVKDEDSRAAITR